MVDIKKLNETIDDLEQHSKRLRSVQDTYKKLQSVSKELEKAIKSQQTTVSHVEELSKQLQQTSNQYEGNLKAIEDRHALLTNSYEQLEKRVAFVLQEVKGELQQELQSYQNSIFIYKNELQSIQEAYEDAVVNLNVKIERQLQDVKLEMQRELEAYRNSTTEYKVQLQSIQRAYGSVVGDLNEKIAGQLQGIKVEMQQELEVYRSSTAEYKGQLQSIQQVYEEAVANLNGQVTKQLQEVSIENSRLYLETKKLLEADLDVKHKELLGNIQDVSRKIQDEHLEIKRSVAHSLATTEKSVKEELQRQAMHQGQLFAQTNTIQEAAKTELLNTVAKLQADMHNSFQLQSKKQKTASYLLATTVILTIANIIITFIR